MNKRYAYLVAGWLGVSAWLYVVCFIGHLLLKFDAPVWFCMPTIFVLIASVIGALILAGWNTEHQLDLVKKEKQCATRH